MKLSYKIIQSKIILIPIVIFIFFIALKISSAQQCCSVANGPEVGYNNGGNHCLCPPAGLGPGQICYGVVSTWQEGYSLCNGNNPPCPSPGQCTNCNSICSGKNYMAASCDTCTASCSVQKTCTVGQCNAECKITKDCGKFSKSCSGGCECSYQAALLSNLQISTVCVNNINRSFVVSGTSSYCGKITITTPWGDSVSTEENLTVFDFKKELSIPLSMSQQEISQNNFFITVRGNRQGIKSQYDEPNYETACTATLELKKLYDNFYYCPKPGQTGFNPRFDIYNVQVNSQPTIYYDFGSGNLDWESCQSNENINACTLNPTDCLGFNARTYQQNTAADADNDGEIEVCHAKDYIQGGWLDPDAKQNFCEIAGGFSSREIDWFSCQTTGGSSNLSCSEGIDDYDNNKLTGFCCGDDLNEFPVITGAQDSSGNDLSASYSACCNLQSDCADKAGVCRSSGFTQCFENGYRSTCNNGKWQIAQDQQCRVDCASCDVNKNNLVDLADTTAISNNISSGDLYYDSNKDGIVDTTDVDFCNDPSVWLKQCFYCGDFKLQSSEDCEELSDGSYAFNCPLETCSEDIDFPNHLLKRRNNEVCSSCLCNYQPVCQAGKCNAECGSDLDCSQNSFCNLEKCQCEFNGCPQGQTWCETLGECRAQCPSGQPCNNNNICDSSSGESCSCPDCNLDFDNCAPGLICSTNTCQPVFTSGYGVYIWENSCNYYMCTISLDSSQHTFEGTINVDEDYSFTDIRNLDFDSDDSYTSSQENSQITFSSKTNEDQDCITFESDSLISFNIKVDGQNNINKIYIGQQKFNPSQNPFSFAGPACSQTCPAPVACGTFSSVLGQIGCDYEECTFSCGGYWTNVNSSFDSLFPEENTGDYCTSCTNATRCLDYNNQQACQHDSCDAAVTNLGCKWNNNQCTDYVSSCPPGTDLCSDGVCKNNCETKPGCIGSPNNVCSVGESCSCPDCIGKQASCSIGAVCGSDELCGCPEGTSLCSDLTCHATCASSGGKKACIGNPNQACEPNEGCACIDCHFRQDSCAEDLICNSVQALCFDEDIEKCDEGETLCNDFTCDETCSENGGKLGCIGSPDNKCSQGEGCSCTDCHFKQGSCDSGLICNAELSECADNDVPKCKVGETLCKDLTCDDTCTNNGGKMECNGKPNNKCEPGEGCACIDCENRQDGCTTGAICETSEEICELASSQGYTPVKEESAGCIDSDEDGYYKIDSSCSGSNDCLDTLSTVYPGAKELCNDRDDDCDSTIDEGCAPSEGYGLEINIQTTEIDALKKNTIYTTIKNTMDSGITGLTIKLSTPNGLKITKNEIKISSLGPKETKVIEFEAYAKDFDKETAVATLSAKADNSEEILSEKEVKVNFLDFKIAADPEQLEMGNECIDFYYVLNNKYGNFDIEFDIINPDSIFSKSIVVDYISGINPNGGILIGKMISNPYCLPLGNYDIYGYLYQSSSWKIVDTIEESHETITIK